MTLQHSFSVTISTRYIQNIPKVVQIYALLYIVLHCT